MSRRLRPEWVPIPTGIRSLFAYFVRHYPGRSVALVALLVLSGLAEGFGVLTLLPLLEVVAGRPATGMAERIVLDALDMLGMEGTVASLLVVLVAALWLKALFRWVAMRQVGYAVARVARDLRLRLVRALLEARWRHHATERAGEIATALGRDAFWAAYAYRHGVGALAGAVQLAAYTGVVMLISWQFGALALVAAALLTAGLGVFIGMSRRAGAAQTWLARGLVSRLLDVVGGMKAIKAMGRERWYRPVLERQTDDLEAAERRQVLATESLRAFQEPALALLLAVLVYLALTRTEIEFATLLVGIFLLHRLVSRAHVVQTEYQGVVAAEAAFVALTRQTEAAAAEREVGAGDAGGRAPTLQDRLELRDVSLAYGARPALRSVSLTVPAHRITVVVGPSGVGKTTLLDLLLGLREPDSGRILVDGLPLNELDRRAWRRRIGYVPQEPVLLDDSIAQNVALGEDVPAGAIERALRQAGALPFVAALPAGVETEVGERGASLSGGERQRIAIARALLHEPLLLVLDEATSELDTATEAEVCTMLRSLRDRVTVVAASHRPALVEVADRCYELADGRLVARGSHDGPC